MSADTKALSQLLELYEEARQASKPAQMDAAKSELNNAESALLHYLALRLDTSFSTLLEIKNMAASIEKNVTQNTVQPSASVTGKRTTISRILGTWNSSSLKDLGILIGVLIIILGGSIGTAVFLVLALARWAGWWQ